MNAEKSFYVGIKNSRELRRNLLTASKEVVEVLKAFHKIKVIRKQKNKKILELKQHLKELNLLVKHLDEALPSMGIRATKKKSKTKKGSKSALPKELPQLPRADTELDALESQLNDIDKKLNSLWFLYDKIITF